MRGPRGAALFHVMFNAYWEALTFELPPFQAGEYESWRRWIDTGRDAPDDVCDVSPSLAPLVDGSHYTVQARSLVVVFALSADGSPRSVRPVERQGGPQHETQR